MSRRITTEIVCTIYDQEIKAGRLRDPALLDGAVNAPFQSGGGSDLYPTLVQKAGKLLDGIQRVQAFTDGNKRVAWLSTNMLLNLNGQILQEVPDEEVDAFVRSLADHPEAEKVAAAWLNARLHGA